MYIYIEVDTNDADYIGRLSEISQEDLETITPLINAIKEFEPYEVNKKEFTWHFNSNYPWGEAYRPDLGEKSAEELYPEISGDIHDLFFDYIPYCEYGFHTITEIKIFDSPAKILL